MYIDFKELEIAFQEIGESLSVIFNEIRKAWNGVKLVVENTDEWLEIYFTRKQQINHMRASWYLIRDNCKSSQVLMNKPRIVVRKLF